jgi:hypothetical protein
MGRSKNLFNMFGRRRNNRGIIWASLLGLGVSAAAYGLRRNGNGNRSVPIQNFMSNFRMQNDGQIPKMATSLTEFSKDLTPNKNQLTSK